MPRKCGVFVCPIGSDDHVAPPRDLFDTRRVPLTWHSLFRTVEGLVAVATVAGVFGGLIALGLSLRQLKLQTGELAAQTNIRTAQRAQDLMSILLDLGHVVVEHPELEPYFREGRDVSATGDECLRSRVLAHAMGYMSFVEIVGWQIRANQLNEDAVTEWGRYFKDLYDHTPALRQVVARDAEMLAAETRWLLGTDEPTTALRSLGFDTKQ